MTSTKAPAVDPTRAVAIDLAGYVAQREQALGARLIDGVPDYSFSLDRTLRARLSSIPPLRWALRSLPRAFEPIMQHVYTMDGIAVGPDQYPRIHAMGEHCARRLGIGVPRIFLLQSEMMNAMTLACDDVRPSIILSTRITRNLAEDELLAIVGHECGHIHNLHGAYNTLVQLMTNPLARGMINGMSRAGLGIGAIQLVLGLAETALTLFLARWSRCAEVSCDRAGVICAGDPMAMVRGLAKLQTGAEVMLDDINVEAYIRQIETVKATPLRLLELGRTHPYTHKRIEAVRLFTRSDVYRGWLPGAEVAGPPLPIAEVDRACEPLISVWSTEGPGELRERAQ